MDIRSIKKRRARIAMQVGDGQVADISRARVAREESGSAFSSEGRTMPLPELVDASSTLLDRLEACECFMVDNGDTGLFWETLAESIRAGISAGQWPVASELLLILEREIQRVIFHDYLKGEHREEIERRVAVLRLSREH